MLLAPLDTDCNPPGSEHTEFFVLEVLTAKDGYNGGRFASLLFLSVSPCVRACLCAATSVGACWQHGMQPCMPCMPCMQSMPCMPSHECRPRGIRSRNVLAHVRPQDTVMESRVGRGRVCARACKLRATQLGAKLTRRVGRRPYVLRWTDVQEADAWCAAIESCALKARKRALSGMPVPVCRYSCACSCALAPTDTRAIRLPGEPVRVLCSCSPSPGASGRLPAARNADGHAGRLGCLA